MPPTIPEHVSSNLQEKIAQSKQRKCSHASEISYISITSTVSEFLEEKIKAHQCDLDILTAFTRSEGG
jgi:hypothetical protein